MSEPKISVCIPTYNGEEYIAECLDSILVQTYDNFEILIIDDDSSDSTLEIAHSYAIKDKRIRIIKNKVNLGLVGNWNHCIKLSKGEWIKFVFHDDLIEPNCLERMLVVANNDHCFVVCRRNFIFSNVSEEIKREYQKFSNEISMDGIFKGKTDITPKDIVNAQLKIGVHYQRNYFGEPTATLIHRDLFSQFGTFNSALIQKCDLEYWLRLSLNIGVRYIPETLAHFRVHKGATTARNKLGREFRMRELDHLVMLHEYIYNPLFLPLKIADASHDKLLTRKLIGKKSRWVYNQAKAAAHRASNPDKSLLAEWNNLLTVYPLLSKTFYFRFYQLHDYINSRFLWRLNNKNY